MTSHRILTPPGWPRGKGYSHGIAAEGELVFVSGQVGWNDEQRFDNRDFVDQLRRALENTLLVLRAADCGPEHVVRMTWYVVDRDAYVSRLAEVGTVYREIMGKSFPAMAVVVVAGLVEPEALVEIETTAVRPRTT